MALNNGCKVDYEEVKSKDVYQTSDLGFSQAIQVNGLLFTSGQVGWDKNYQFIGNGSFEEQLKQSIYNLKEIANAGNSSLENIILLRIYVKNLDSEKRALINQYLKAEFETVKPASTLLGVNSLAREDLLIEIEMIAKTID
jgi:enamine deaminase RidA (YjgF/YER057c/UK114 family)